jgi:membrane protease YdiL (CAAX protease family)
VVNPLRELLHNASETYRLEPRYYRLTSCVGLLGVLVGIRIFLVGGEVLAALLHVTPDGPLRSQPNGTLWIVAFIACIPVAVYAGAVLVAGVFAAVMVGLGKVTPAEALPYTLLSRYPVSWFKSSMAPAPSGEGTAPGRPLWQRLPVVVRAVLTGAVVATAGTVPWALLASANVKHGSAVPWAVPPAALYLWLFWRYVRGAGWPASTAETRRTTCRAHRLSDEVWGAAMMAGILGLVALVLLLRVVNRMVTLPAQPTDDLSHLPFMTLVPLLLMGAVVAGIAEESAFRGYMQGPIERRHGPVIAILVTGGLFGLAHFTHPEVTLILMPYYLAVAAIYGSLAYLTNSIMPSVVLHAGGNVLGAIGLFAGGRSDWQAASSPEPLIWESGADASFWLSFVAALGAGAAALWAYAALATVARKEPAATHAPRWREDAGQDTGG